MGQPTTLSWFASRAVIPTAGWMTALFLAAWLCAEPPQYLNCRCGFGPVKCHTASLVYGLIAVRSALAVVSGSRSWGWVVQLAMTVAVAPLVELIVTDAGGH